MLSDPSRQAHRHIIKGDTPNFSITGQFFDCPLIEKLGVSPFME
jgi:hypothetical protein